MAMKSLTATSIFQLAEETMDNKLSKKIMDLSLKRGGTIDVTYDMIQNALTDITSRTSPFRSKYEIEMLFKRRVIQLVYNEGEKLTNAIPFFRVMHGGKASVVVNITNWARLKQDGEISIQPQVLYALMLSAAFSLEIDQSIESLTSILSPIYGRLFSNIVHNLAYTDKVKAEKIEYLATNFLIYQINPESKAFNPFLARLKYNSQDAIVNLESKLSTSPDSSSYADMRTFIDSLRTVFPEMQKLTYSNFVNRWATSYGPASLFAFEYIPYFIFMLVSAAIMAPIVNVNKISIEADKFLGLLYDRVERRVSAMK